VLPAPTGGTAPETTPTSSTGNAPQTDDHHVDIPNFFHLSTVAYFTPAFAPKTHNHQEENHFHPPSADTNDGPFSDDASSFKGKEGPGSLNPAPQPATKSPPPLPQLKLKQKKQATQQASVQKAKAKSAITEKKMITPKIVFLNGKRNNKK